MTPVNRRRLALAAAATASLLAGCGDDATCYIIDSAGSTQDMQLLYREELERGIAEDASRGRRAHVLISRGDPRTESIIESGSFGGLESVEMTAQRDQAHLDLLTAVENRVADAQAGIAVASSGSAIADAIDVIADGGCAAGLVVLSDGLENVAFNVYEDPITTARGQRQIARRLPDMDGLDGVEVRFPYGGIVPRGSRLSRARKRALKPLWTSVIESSGGTLRWGLG